MSSDSCLLSSDICSAQLSLGLGAAHFVMESGAFFGCPGLVEVRFFVYSSAFDGGVEPKNSSVVGDGVDDSATHDGSFLADFNVGSD